MIACHLPLVLLIYIKKSVYSTTLSLFGSMLIYIVSGISITYGFYKFAAFFGVLIEGDINIQSSNDFISEQPSVELPST